MTDKPADENEPRIIVDDDWKERVQMEKEQLEGKSQTGQQEPPISRFELPPASFALLVTTLSTQALSALGFVPDPDSGQTTSNRPMAKHFIDTLGVLEEKTRGNLTEDESQLLSETVHQLRMAYVAGKDSSDQSNPASPEPVKSSIELP